MKAKRFASVDRDLAGALPALRRAAAAARRLSIETSTPFYVFENGCVVDRNAARREPGPRGAGRNGRRRLRRGA
jgi:hypothetical protein